MLKYHIYVGDILYAATRDLGDARAMAAALRGKFPGQGTTIYADGKSIDD